LDWLVFIPKRAKLFISFFQQLDFLTRAGVGSWHGMVNALRTGHPIEAVEHLAKYPATASEILIANFSPRWRQKLRTQLSDTKPIISSRPGVTMQSISSAAAQLANIKFSTIPASQSVVQNRFVREVLRRLFFSMGESEGLLRQAAGVVRPGAQFRSFWIEHWVGAYLFLISTANAIHWASTGKVLPFDRYSPISEDDYGPLPFGYNSKFASPTIPIGGKGGLEIRMDLVGQLDTAFRVFDPKGFVTSRVNVPIRALETQSNARDFYGQSVDEVGPGGVLSRTTTLAQDLFAPIGPGSGGLSVLAELTYVLRGTMKSSRNRSVGTPICQMGRKAIAVVNSGTLYSMTD
jgi:hypothetical protein